MHWQQQLAVSSQRGGEGAACCSCASSGRCRLQVTGRERCLRLLPSSSSPHSLHSGHSGLCQCLRLCSSVSSLQRLLPPPPAPHAQQLEAHDEQDAARPPAHSGQQHLAPQLSPQLSQRCLLSCPARCCPRWAAAQPPGPAGSAASAGQQQRQRTAQHISHIPLQPGQQQAPARHAVLQLHHCHAAWHHCQAER
jgi:hypothetical protein